jgi:hypothetical protein
MLHSTDAKYGWRVQKFPHHYYFLMPLIGFSARYRIMHTTTIISDLSRTRNLSDLVLPMKTL